MNRKHSPPLPGIGCELVDTPHGTIVRGRARSEWEHPWTITPVWEETEDGEGEWRGYIAPGFLNGRDVYIGMHGTDRTNGSHGTDGGVTDVALTDEVEPYLVLGGWRNPLLPQGVSASSDGRVLAGKPEGYPPALEELGVKVPARGGDVSQAGALEAGSDEERSRELRAVDVVLTQPRIGSRLESRVGSGLVDGQTQFLDTVFTNDLVRSSGGRAKLRVVPKYVPVSEEQNLPGLLGTLLNAGDAQMDQLLMATIWMLSPPGAEADAEPDQSWEPVPQYFVFWNLCHATRVVMPRVANPPLRLQTGLAGGLADTLGNALLAAVNDASAEVEAFLGQADARGRFWEV